MHHIAARALRALALVLVLALPAQLQAQAETVYSQSELDTPPKLSSQEMTARLLAKSYPPALKSAGVTGTVQVQFVVDEAGKVEPNSVKVLSSTVPALADAAVAVVGEIKFKPGVLKGQPVKTAVLLPIVYK